MVPIFRRIFAITYVAVSVSFMSFCITYTPYDGDDFIIRWGFQKICNHVYDPRTISWAHPTSLEPGGVSFNPPDVKTGDIIFVRDLEKFFEEMHPKIMVPYIIITHGEFRDTCMEYHLTFLEDSKIIAWFSIHPPKQGHKKFFPLPIGISQKEYKEPDLHDCIKKCRAIPKKELAYLNWSSEQNPERHFVEKLFKECCDFTIRQAFIPFKDYLEEMAHYKFALSPRGWGPDCYRTWEALLVGTIPVVKRCQFDALIVGDDDMADPGQKSTLSSPKGSQLDTLYEDLPILIIDEWESITPQFLLQKYEEISSKTYNIERLYVAYWKTKIEGVREAFLKSYLPESAI